MSPDPGLADPVDPDATHLVTGGAGFIGSNLVHALAGAGADVRVLDDFSTGRRVNLEGVADRIELIEGSVTDPATCAEACRGVDFVLHQAALPSVQRSVDEPVPTHDVDATGTLNMLVAARDAGVRRFVYAASSSAYGDTEAMPKVERAPSRPRSPYSVAKLAGEQTRDFTYVENVVRANLLACAATGPGIAGEVFNVGCGERITVNRLWSTIRDVTGADVDAHHGPPRPGDVRHSLASLEKIGERLGHEPVIGLEEGLRRTVECFGETGGA